MDEMTRAGILANPYDWYCGPVFVDPPGCEEGSTVEAKAYCTLCDRVIAIEYGVIHGRRLTGCQELHTLHWVHSRQHAVEARDG